MNPAASPTVSAQGGSRVRATVEMAGRGTPATEYARTFAMPNSNTLAVRPMRDFARKYLAGGYSVDPFARDCRLADVTNDLSPATAADYHMDAEAFCQMLAMQGCLFDVAIFDPPYSPRQISECYQQIGRAVGTTDTQNAALYRRVRDALDKIIKPGGIVLSFGWNSNGMGKGRSYDLLEMLIVAHGGAHNDTICIAERKPETVADLFAQPLNNVRRDGPDGLCPAASCASSHSTAVSQPEQQRVG